MLFAEGCLSRAQAPPPCPDALTTQDRNIGHVDDEHQQQVVWLEHWLMGLDAAKLQRL
jgi:hypothetical protein